VRVIDFTSIIPFASAIGAPTAIVNCRNWRLAPSMMMFPATFGVFCGLQVMGFNANVLNVLLGFLCSHVI
jgi:hypothetical protein